MKLAAFLIGMAFGADPVSELHAATANVTTLPVEAGKHARYLSMYHVPLADRVEAMRVAKFFLNSLSDRPTFGSVELVNESMLRIDLRDFGMDQGVRWAATWEKIDDGYFGVYSEAQLNNRTESKVPIVRLDTFFAKASVDPLYSGFLGYGKTLDDVTKQFRIDTDANTKLFDLEQQAAIVRSRVALGKGRHVVRYQSLFGAWYFTRDVLSNDGKRNVLDAANVLAITPEAGEFIFDLANGLHGCFLTNAKNELVPVADPNAAQDYRTPLFDHQIRAGRSCLACHNIEAGGYQPFSDVVRLFIDQKRLKTYDKAQAQKIESLHYRNLQELWTADNERYAAAVKRCCGLEPKEAGLAFEKALHGYLVEPIVLANATTELGIDEPRWKELALGLEAQYGAVPGEINAIEQGIGIARDLWEASVFPMLLKRKYEVAR